MLVASLQVFGRWRVDARPDALDDGCAYALRVVRAGPAPAAPPGWRFVAAVRRPTDHDDLSAIYARDAAPSSTAAPAR